MRPVARNPSNQARPVPPAASFRKATTSGQQPQAAELSPGARHLLRHGEPGSAAAKSSASNEAARGNETQAAPQKEATSPVSKKVLHETAEASKERDEPPALIKAANWLYESVLAAFTSAAVRQLQDVASAAWDGVVEVSTRAAELVVNASLLVVGSGISALQTMFGLERPGRELNAREERWLREVFGPGLDTERIRLKEGFAGIASLSDRPFAFGNTVYLKSNAPPADASRVELQAYRALLIHEATHVWQHQHGNTPMAESIWHDRVLGDAYDWRGGIDEGKAFHELNVEQQAQFLGDAARAGYFEHPEEGFVSGGTDYTCQLEQAMREVRRP